MRKIEGKKEEVIIQRYIIKRKTRYRYCKINISAIGIILSCIISDRGYLVFL